MTTVSKPVSVRSRILRRLLELLWMGIVRVLDVIVFTVVAGYRVVFASLFGYAFIRIIMGWLLDHASLLMQSVAILIGFPLFIILAREFIFEERAKKTLA